jgi:1-aminocyclopropane-1-carboxylate deaminase/D-cysteine desulfhydrase-like pyridoxal-dependent ACC family enzyme
VICQKIQAPTPLVRCSSLSKKLDISLWLKCDDVFPLALGGNKARKLKYIFEKGVSLGCNAVVTTGSKHSNHVRAAAVMAANFGWPIKLIIHDYPCDSLFGNLLIAKLAGAQIAFCSREDVAARMDSAMDEFRSEGLHPLYIWGGGHCLEGGLSYYEAAMEMHVQAREVGELPDFVFVASGTGTTQAGLHVGLSRTLPKAKVVGISVAHDRAKGLAKVQESIQQLQDHLAPYASCHAPEFFDIFLNGGYGKTSSELIEKIKWAACEEGLILDPIYTGKAFQGLLELVKSGFVPKGATVVFWHTGGLINLLASGMQGDQSQ